jgi:hypothetical protein
MNKVLGLSKLVWTIIFLCIQIINFSFLVAAMDYDYWFKQKWKYPGGSYNYRGRLLTNKKDLDFCDDGDGFKYCYDKCRDKCDDFRYKSDDCKDSCDRFKRWYDAGAVYVAFDTIGSIITVLIAVMIIVSFFRIQRLKRIVNLFNTAILMIVVFVCHFLAFVIYAGLAKLKFDDCSHDFDYDGSESVCGEGGASFALFILFWLLIIVPNYFLIARKIKISDENEEGSNYNQIHLR